MFDYSLSKRMSIIFKTGLNTAILVIIVVANLTTLYILALLFMHNNAREIIMIYS